MNDKPKFVDAATTVKPNANVLSRRLGDQMVLFHLETDRFYELNGTAARFWELISAGSSVADVRGRMIEEFAVDPDQFAREAADLVDSLRKEDLISVDD
jgi:hypothetical protein